MATNPLNDDLSKSLAEQLIDEITSAKWQEEARLPAERVLCQQYDVSRATLREALSALEVLGIIYTRRGGGSYVAKRKEAVNRGIELVFSFAGYDLDIDTIMDFRRILEMESVRLAIQNCSDFRRLRLRFDMVLSNLQDCIDNEYVEGCVRYDQEFHEIIIQEANNVLLQVSHQASVVAYERKTGVRFMSFYGKSATREDNAIMQQMHINIADAIVSGNTGLACKLMLEHNEIIRLGVLHSQALLQEEFPQQTEGETW